MTDTKIEIEVQQNAGGHKQIMVFASNEDAGLVNSIRIDPARVDAFCLALMEAKRIALSVIAVPRGIVNTGTNT